MAGQSAMLPLSKARSQAKGAGHDLGCSNGGSRPTVPTEGKTLGDSKGKSASAGAMNKGESKKKTSQMM